MSEFWQQLSNPFFWFSTIVMGIIVGIVGNLATNGVQKIWAQFSETQKQKAKEQEEAFESELQALINNPTKITEIKIDIILSLLRLIVKIVLYLIIVNVSYVLPFFLSGFATFIINFIISALAVSTIVSSLNGQKKTRRLLDEYTSRTNPN